MLTGALAAAAAVVVTIGAVSLVVRPGDPPVPPGASAATSIAVETAESTPQASPATSEAPHQSSAALLVPTPTESPSQRPEPAPSAGLGTFGYDDRSGELLGRSGPVRRYRVAVEDGSGEDARAFGAEVEQVLAAEGSWVGGGGLRLQQVPGDARYDFTIYLTTARTAQRMCAAGGVDIRVGGRPYTSCRAPKKVIINLDRWRTAVPHYVEAGVPLSVYRAYVINHEVGHELGYRHERCPGQGQPAPVMMQQTLFLKGCVANPWPYLEGRRYAGPRL